MERPVFSYYWIMEITIPFHEFAEYLTDAEYEAMKDTEAEYRVSLAFRYDHEDADVGIPSPSFCFENWDYVNPPEYNEYIERAIGSWIEHNEETLCDNAYEQYCDYCDYIKYGNI